MALAPWSCWLTPSVAGPRLQGTVSTTKGSRNGHSSNKGVTLVVTAIAMHAQLSCQLWWFPRKAKKGTTTIPGKRWISFGNHHLRLSALMLQLAVFGCQEEGKRWSRTNDQEWCSWKHSGRAWFGLQINSLNYVWVLSLCCLTYVSPLCVCVLFFSHVLHAHTSCQVWIMALLPWAMQWDSSGWDNALTSAGEVQLTAGRWTALALWYFSSAPGP